MKLMKLLLIGLLSVGALVACAEDEGTAAKVSIVGIDGNAPVLFDNISVGLKAVDAAGDAIAAPQVATWGETDANTGFTVSATGVVKVDLTKPIVGSVTLSVKTPKDTAVDGSVDTYDNVSYAPVVSAFVLESIVITPATDSVAVDATLALIATAKFDTGDVVKDVVITTDAAWSSADASKVSVATTGVVTGEEIDATGTAITAKLTSNGVEASASKTIKVTGTPPQVKNLTSYVVTPVGGTGTGDLELTGAAEDVVKLQVTQDTVDNTDEALRDIATTDTYTCVSGTPGTATVVEANCTSITLKATGKTAIVITNLNATDSPVTVTLDVTVN